MNDTTEENGYEKAKKVAQELKKTTGIVRAESSKEMAQVKTNLEIKGLEDVPANMIPIPFYKFVQPGSTKVAIKDGSDAKPGTIYMGDSGEAVEQLTFALLRAKRQHREFTNDQGQRERTTNMGILGLNLETMTPFILSLSISSFAAFGRLMKQYKDRGAMRAWEYPVILTSEKREEMKIVQGVQKHVKYWVAVLNLDEKKIDEETLAMLDEKYNEFAGTLDRDVEEDIQEANVVVEGEREPF